jgi:sugar phosphate isomerase/epimerase
MLLPPDYRNERSFIDDLSVLRTLEFDGVELNIRDPQQVRPDDLKGFLADFGLTLSMFASGASAKALNLSLAATDEAERKRAVENAKGYLEFAAQFGAGVIAGFLKGPMAHSTEAHRLKLAESIAELAPVSLRCKTPLQIEAINRFESPLGHSLDETYELVKDCAHEYLWILPDTWHMNIEEANLEAAIIRHQGHFGSFHLSDNNRFFPGLGGIDFKRIIGVLEACGYAGKLAIEGNIKTSFSEDIRACARFLDPILCDEGVFSFSGRSRKHWAGMSPKGISCGAPRKAPLE